MPAAARRLQAGRRDHQHRRLDRSRASRTCSASSASTAAASLHFGDRSRRREADARGDARRCSEQNDAFGGTFRRGLIGITPSRHARDHRDAKQVGPPRGRCASACARPTRNIAQTLQGIGDIITRRQAADQMGGPILMAEVTAKVAELGHRADAALDRLHLGQHRLPEPAADPGARRRPSCCSTPSRRCAGAR